MRLKEIMNKIRFSLTLNAMFSQFHYVFYEFNVRANYLKDMLKSDFKHIASHFQCSAHSLQSFNPLTYRGNPLSRGNFLFIFFLCIGNCSSASIFPQFVVINFKAMLRPWRCRRKFLFSHSIEVEKE